MAWTADPRLLEILDRHTRVRLTRDLVELCRARVPKLHVEPEAWRIGCSRLAGHRDLPAQLQADLHQLTPQAILRDLHRPEGVGSGHDAHEPFEALRPDPAGWRALADARAARTRDPLPFLTPSARLVASELTRRRKFLVEPWQPYSTRVDSSERAVIT